MISPLLALGSKIVIYSLSFWKWSHQIIGFKALWKGNSRQVKTLSYNLEGSKVAENKQSWKSACPHQTQTIT